MTMLKLALGGLLGMTALSAIAQVPAPTGSDPLTGARPGHTAGIGESLPKSDKASHTSAATARSPIAPTLPGPSIGEAGQPSAYLTIARAAVVAGKSGLALQSLEMAETRALDRVVPPGGSIAPSSLDLVATIRDARLALGGGDPAGALTLIDRALLN